MQNLIPGIIMSFREGLEAFLIIVLIIKFLEKAGKKHLNKYVIYGLITSIITSILFGYILYLIGHSLENVKVVGNIWESFASLVAVGLVTTFIIWMIKNSHKIKKYIENKVSKKLSKIGIFVISFIMVIREGVEIAIFAFAGEYHYVSILTGIILSIIITLTIYYSLIKINLTTIFKVTLIYLIIQAGYLLGYGIHEGIGSIKTLGYLNENNFVFTKLFDLSSTILNHKEGIIGLPLNVLFGWYSKPEIVQFIIQYTFTISLLIYWRKENKNS